ncbi:uncharacterized protein G2W53_021923 [Senna tora]|uniref:Uncharacterized protein n=1 Tax=Senna tora TaxID=362788 RepID=A0A834TM44_9FABA|nr:uncharacterized protein G2W53_021923 [Senna tora]
MEMRRCGSRELEEKTVGSEAR